MTYPAPFLRLVVAGPLFSAERWSFSLSMVPDFPGDEPGEITTGVENAVQGLLAGANVSGAAGLDTIKLNLIGPNGRYVNQDTIEKIWPVPNYNGRTADYVAPQLALAVSLTTARSRGLAHAGRFYLPVPKWSIDNTGRISAANALTTANAAADFVNALNTATPGYRVGVASDVGAGAFEAVTGVRVGRTLDTIRSRRTSLPEDYQVAATAITG